MKLNKFFALFFIAIVSLQTIKAAEPKDDIKNFLTAFNGYSLEKYDIKYSPAELAIKKAIEAFPKIGVTDTIFIENKKYSKDRIYDSISISLKEKSKNIDQLGKIAGDIRLIDKELGKKGDVEVLFAMSKHYEERKKAGTNFYEIIPDEISVMRAISAGRFITNSAEKAKLKNTLDFIIKEKQQILKELETSFKKLPAQIAVSGSVSASVKK